MNFEKLKAAEVVEGEKLGHPDDTYGGRGRSGCRGDLGPGRKRKD